jgi:MFS family permease
MFLNLFLPFFVIHCVEQVYFVYGNVLRSYGLSSEAIGWILGSFFVTNLTIRPFGGWVLEKFGIRKTLVWSSALCIVGSAILFLTDDVGPLLLGRILMGFGFGINTIGLFSYQSIAMKGKMRGATLALVMSGGILPMATVTPLGEWLLADSRLTLYLALGPILSVICLYFGSRVGVSKTPEGPKKKDERSWGTYGDLLSSRTFVILALTGTAIALVDAAAINISLFAEERGLIASYFLAGTAVTAVIVRIAGAKAINALPRAVSLCPCGILMACGTMLLSLRPSNASFLASGVLFGIGIGAGWPVLHSLLGDTLEVALRPKGMAVTMLMYDAGWFVTPILFGFVAPVLGMATTIFFLSSFVLIVLALIQIFYWLPFQRTRI